MAQRGIGQAEMLTSDSNVAMQNTYLHAPGRVAAVQFEAVFGKCITLEHIVSPEGAWENGSVETMRIGGPTGWACLKKKIVHPLRSTGSVSRSGERVAVYLDDVYREARGVPP